MAMGFMAENMLRVLTFRNCGDRRIERCPCRRFRRVPFADRLCRVEQQPEPPPQLGLKCGLLSAALIFPKAGTPCRVRTLMPSCSLDGVRLAPRTAFRCFILAHG